MSGSPSFNDLAAHIESNSPHNPSQQAVADRLNGALEIFIQSVLGHFIAGKVSTGPGHAPVLF